MNKDTFIHRRSKTKNYTVVSNNILKNEKLSWKAKGIFVYLISLPDDWVIHLSEVMKHSLGGKKNLYSGIRELINYGYIKKVPIKRKKDNIILGVRYEVFEKPKKVQK